MFSCAGRRVALMNAFRRAMAELNVSGRLISTDITRSSAAFHLADLGLIVPKVADEAYIPTLMDYVRRHEVGLLVPLTDLDLLLLARHRDAFAREGCMVMIGSEEMVEICRDKSKTAELFTRAGLAAIPTLPLETFLKNPFYPCFVKPVAGSAGVGSAIIQSPAQMKVHIAAFGEELIAQEYVPGREFTIDVYRSRDGRVRCVVPRQRLVVRSGEVEKGITINDEGLIQSAIRLAGAMGDLWGVFCCQCRMQNIPGAQPQFFEINPRFGGGATLSVAAGANLPLYLLQEVLSLPITAKLGEFTDYLLLLRYDNAVFVRIDQKDLKDMPGAKTPYFR